jgi:phage-related protein
MSPPGKPLVWLRGEIKTPPFTAEARVEAGHLLRLVQLGRKVGMPHSRLMPTIAPRCHEMRVKDARSDWRIVYRVDADAVVIADIFAKTTRSRPDNCGLQDRLKMYDDAK